MYKLKIICIYIIYIIMAYYTSSIQTEVLNPVYNQSKYRSEFRLDQDMLYTPFMRVCNLGVLATAASFADQRKYNRLTGVCGVVRNIFLYDDKQVLDQVLNYKDYGAFKNFNSTNSDNQDVKKNLKKHGLGFVYDTDSISGSTITTLIKQYNPVTGGHIPTNDDATSPTGYLDLRDVFPLLKSVEFISTTIFKNLKVVIEYDVNNLLTTGTNADLPSATTVPVLVVDKVVNDQPFIDKFLSEFKGVSWNCMEMESVQLPLITPPASGVQSQKYRLNGFTDKTLGVLLLQKKPVTVLSTDYLNNGSISLINETIQVAVNGSNILPDDGVIAPNQRLALLTDTFGNCNAFSGCNMTGFINCTSSVENTVQRVGQLDYFGCAVGKKISALDVTVSRKNTAGIDARYKQAVELQFWGSVTKAIVVGKDNSYQVIYV
jgi:hypothetical protein